MNKVRVTKKSARENHKIIGIGYCNAQALLHYEAPVAFSAGRDGWQCDYYDIDGVIISTGYSPLKNKNVNYNYETLKNYEEKAAAITANYSEDWEARRAAVRELLAEFVATV